MCRQTSKFAAIVAFAAACVVVVGISSFNNDTNEATAQTPAQRGDMKNMQGMKDMPGMKDMDLIKKFIQQLQ